MNPRFAELPSALREQSIIARFGANASIPALIAHPDPHWHAIISHSSGTHPPPSPRPAVLWFHGRTVNKELDPGRYLRWIRAGLGAIAIDLPGHGERFDAALQTSGRTLEVVEQAAQEIDVILAALAAPPYTGLFDLTRLAIGGMSAGGMVTLHRLTREHPFRAAAVEATAGTFEYFKGRPFYIPERVERAEAIRHLDHWRPIPLLALHSEADQWVPLRAISDFTDALRARYQQVGADPSLITLKTWPTTGAQYEHMGFGRVSHEAKTIQTEFFAKHLLG
ncbi:MAG TPA: alpha/beta fold hydrolase [Phycisphaerales bacterium]|nr:alpha/beta fold hydrolase [Phycisphaerales bacterium]